MDPQRTSQYGAVAFGEAEVSGCANDLQAIESYCGEANNDVPMTFESLNHIFYDVSQVHQQGDSVGVSRAEAQDQGGVTSRRRRRRTTATIGAVGVCLIALVSYLNGWVGDSGGTSYGAQSAMGEVRRASKDVVAAPLPAPSSEHQKNVMLITLDDVVTQTLNHNPPKCPLMPTKGIKNPSHTHC